MKYINKSKNFSSWISIIIFHLLIYQKIISDIVPFFDNFDEILLVFLFLYFLTIVFMKRKIKIEKKVVLIWCLFFIFLILGLLGNSLYKYQNSIFLVLLGLVFYLKPILSISLGMMFLENKSIHGIVRNQIKLIKLEVTIIFIFGIINLLINSGIFGVHIDIGMTHDFRYGIPSYKFIFGTAGELVLACVYFISILFMQYNKRNSKYIFMCVIICIISLRGVGISCMVVFIIFYLFFKYRLKISITKIIAISPLLALAGWNQFSQYFILNNDAARYNLMYYSLVNAKRFFPLGSGFSTYGSAPTVKNYSILYYEYNFGAIWGLGQAAPYFINDSFWPMLIGETGVLGTIIYIFILLNILLFIIEKTKKNKVCNLISLFLFTSTIIYSLSTTSVLVGNYSVFIFLIMSLVIMKANEEKEHI